MANQDYHDFSLKIDEFGANQLRVTLVNSPVGSSSADMANPFTAAEIAHVIGLLESAAQVMRPASVQEIRAFGEKLFVTLFSGPIDAAYRASLKRAGDAGLRIRLDTSGAGSLAGLPWELLREPQRNYLALSPQTPVVRLGPIRTALPPVEIHLPLRCLVMISSPGDREPIDVEGEWRALQESTLELRNRGLLELERLDDADPATLEQKLHEGTSYQIFHFIGHVVVEDQSGTPKLAFHQVKPGTTIPVDIDALVDKLGGENTIRLVVLNTLPIGRDPLARLAERAATQGTPAVVTTQFVGNDQVSRSFAQTFYQTLAECYPLETALTAARQALAGKAENVDWAGTVLYLGASGGILFPRQPVSNRSVVTGGVRERLASPVGIVSILAALVILFAGGFFVSHLPGPFPAQPTQTSVPTQSNPSVTVTPPAGAVDLAVTSLRFSPPNPVPGQHVTIAMAIKNLGGASSGTFNWAWYAHDPQIDPTPSVTGQVANLDPGQTLNVRGDFYFGMWGTYITTAWVNYDGLVKETTLLNNLMQKPAITSNVPMIVDFTLQPSGDALDAGPLKADQFSQWGFTIMADNSVDANCKAATVEVEVLNDANRLITGLPEQHGQCSNLPIIFALDQPIGGVTVKFQANAPGRYTLDLFDDADKKLQSASTVADASQPELTIRAPSTTTGMTNIRKIRFSGPDNGNVAIKNVAFSMPSQPAP